MERPSLPVFWVGLEAGETLVPSPKKDKQNRGSRLKIIEGFFPPSALALESLTPAEWVKVLQFLDSRESYQGLSSEAKKAKLIATASKNKNVYLSDPLMKPEEVQEGYKPLKVEVESLGGSIFEGLDLSRFSLGAHSLYDLYKAIPEKKASTKAHRHTLVFRPGIWEVVAGNDSETEIEWDGPVYDLSNGRLLRGDSSGRLLLVPELGIAVKDSPAITDKEWTFESLLSLWEEPTNLHFSAREGMRGFTPSVHKSLIQKIIRTGTTSVIVGNEEIPGEIVLLVSFIELILDPGVFVPDLQTFETGLKSGLKRLAVSIFEDSYSSQPEGLLSLLLGALLTSDKKWRPSKETLKNWFSLALESHQDPRFYRYSTSLPKKRLGRKKAPGPLELAFEALSILRSFETDLNMVEHIALEGGAYNTTNNKPLESIPIYHAIDHHNHTEIGLYLHSNFVMEKYKNFSEVFKDLWDHSSGINYRKKDGRFSKGSRVLKEVRRAQKMVYDRIQGLGGSKESVPDTAASYNFDYILPDSWLGALMGPQEVRAGRRTFLVSLDSEFFPKVMIRPSRTGDYSKITDEEREEVITKFHQILRKEGVPLIPGTRGLVRKLFPSGSKVYENSEGNYTVGKVPWEKVKVIKETYPELPKARTLTIEGALKNYGAPEGIREGAFDTLDELVDKLPRRALLRTLYYIRGIRSKIELNRINREGLGTEYAVYLVDNLVFHFFASLTILFPGCWSLSPRNNQAFVLKSLSFYWHLRYLLEDKLNESQGDEENSWPPLEDRLHRKMMPHQISTVSKILESKKRAHIIDQTVGLGKTLQACEVFRRLVALGKAPPYFIYTLPESALESIRGELEAYGFEVRILDPRKGRKGLRIDPYVANVIVHDHLRLGELPELLREKISQSFFLLDEMHLTLNPTIRTSIALELATQARFFIGMSGTIVKDTQFQLLIPYLELITEYEVNEQNFWTAMGEMISYRLALPIKTNEIEIEAEWPLDLELEYNSLLGKGKKLSPQDFREAIRLCYEVCHLEMIRVAEDYLAEGRTVFLVAKDVQSQERIRKDLLGVLKDREIFLIGPGSTLRLEETPVSPIRAVVTTFRHSTGYTITKASVMITSVYFTSQATRDQLEGRIKRISQRRKEIDVVTVHTGLLTNILERYDLARNMMKALKSVALEVGLDREEIKLLGAGKI